MTTNRPETRVERKERTRRAILDAALALCEDSSLAAVSLRQVAKEVGIVPTAFYRHFASLEELGLSLVEESFVALRSMLRELRRGAPHWENLVDDSIAVLVEHVQRQHRHFAFIARERFAGPATVREAIARGIELFERELATDLAHLPNTGTWSDTDLRIVSSLIVNLMVAIVEDLIAAGALSDAERTAAAAARTQLRMLMIGALNWESKR